MLRVRKHPSVEEAVSGVKALRGERPPYSPAPTHQGGEAQRGFGGPHPQPAGHTQCHLDGDTPVQIWGQHISRRGVQSLGVCGPQWKKKSCLGPHIKYTNTNEN